MTIVLGRVDGTAGSPAPHAIGDHWEVFGVLTFTSQYTTGGDAFDATALITAVGVGVADYVALSPIVGYILTYDYVNKKVQVWSVQSATTSPLVEIAGSPTNYPTALLTAATSRVHIIGR